MILSLGLTYDLRIDKNCKKMSDLSSSYYCHLLSKYKKNELMFVGHLQSFYVMILVFYMD